MTSFKVQPIWSCFVVALFSRADSVHVRAWRRQRLFAHAAFLAVYICVAGRLVGRFLFTWKKNNRNEIKSVCVLRTGPIVTSRFNVGLQDQCCVCVCVCLVPRLFRKSMATSNIHISVAHLFLLYSFSSFPTAPRPTKTMLALGRKHLPYTCPYSH